MVNLQDFANGQAFSDQAVWSVDGGEGVVSLEDLLAQLGLQGPVLEAYDKVQVYFSSTVTSLLDLTERWRRGLRSLFRLEERREGDLGNTLTWLQNTAPRDQDGHFVCVYCGFVCRERQKRGPTLLNTFRSHMIHEHFKVSDPREFVNCFLCGKQVVGLAPHCREEHPGERMTCKFCDKSVPADKFPRHMKLCQESRNEGSGPCTICDNNIFHRDLSRHKRKLHPVRLFFCDHCDKTFNSQRILLAHKASVQGTAVKKECLECKNFFVDLNEHLRRFHSKTKRIRNRTNRYKYQKQTNRTNAESKCLICGKRFADGFKGGCFNKHLRQNHTTNIFQKLGITYSMNTENGQEREEIAQIFMKNQSITIFPDKEHCQLCNRKCVSKTQMIVHMKRHLGFSRPKGKAPSSHESVICPKCGKSVQSKGHVCSNDNNIYTPGKVSDCKVCGTNVHSEKWNSHRISCYSNTFSLESAVISKQGPRSSSPAPWSSLPALVRCPDCMNVVAREDLKVHTKECHLI